MDSESTGYRWHDIGSAEAVPAGEMRPFEIGEHYIALYNVDGQIYATNNVCSHGEALLTDGYLDNDIVECPLHGGQFEVCSGKAMCAPAETDLQTHLIRVVGGRIEVRLPE
jgi:nitrite reductase/ring-hydroxylating ferredoxin subunit